MYMSPAEKAGDIFLFISGKMWYSQIMKSCEGGEGMTAQKRMLQDIPVILWGEPSDKIYIHVHGKMSCKESARVFAGIAAEKGYQTISFDLPMHGERTDPARRCDIWNGVRDLKTVGDYVFSNWKEVSLYGCSLGAYFSLHAYGNRNFRKCLFQSPIVDMDYLIGQMMLWFGITEQRLREEREIETPIDLMTWDYYRYVKDNPITSWDVPTAILYGAKDTLQSRKAMEHFCDNYGCRLTVAEHSDHPFMDEQDGPIVTGWMRENI